MTDQTAETESPAARTGEASDEEAVRERAYEISRRDDSGSAAENWRRAEAELRGTPGTNGQA